MGKLQFGEACLKVEELKDYKKPTELDLLNKERVTFGWDKFKLLLFDKPPPIPVLRKSFSAKDLALSVLFIGWAGSVINWFFYYYY